MNFKDITTIKDTCCALNLNYDKTMDIFDFLRNKDTITAYTYMVQIVRKALNLGYEMYFTKGKIYYPYNPIITTESTYFDTELQNNKLQEIMAIEIDGKKYKLLGGRAYTGSYSGISRFSSRFGVATSLECNGFLGCATREIAEHFSKYFGILITKAKFGELIKTKEIIQKVQKLQTRLIQGMSPTISNDVVQVLIVPEMSVRDKVGVLPYLIA